MKSSDSVKAVLLLAGLCVNFVLAQDIFKANNSTALIEPASWVGGVVPDSSKVAVWSDIVDGAQSVELGGTMSWSGIRLANPGGTVTINGSNKLTLSGGAATDIDLEAAMQDLVINTPLGLAGTQVANIAAGRRVTLNGLTTATSLTRYGDGLLVINSELQLSTTGNFIMRGGTTILRGRSSFPSGSGDGFQLLGGDLIFDGGELTLSSSIGRIAIARGNGNLGGTLIVSNGTHSVAGNNNDSQASFVGVSGAQAGRLVMEGGELTFRYLRLSTNIKGVQASGVPDEIIVNGGTLSVIGESSGFMMSTPHQVNSSGECGREGRLIINGGRFEVPNSFARITPEVTELQHTGRADIYLNGGVFAVKELLFGSDSDVARTVTFNGGTLEGVNLAKGAELVVNPPPFIVSAGGAVIAAKGGADFTITADFVEDASSQGGGLTKIGTGRISLVGQHSISGPVVVDEGVLNIVGSEFLHSELIVNSEGGISLADGAISVFRPDSLRMGTGMRAARLELEVAESGMACDRLVIPATAWFQRVIIDLVKIGTGGPVVREGDFVVLEYEGAAPNLANLSYGNPATGYACTFSLDTEARTVTAHVRAVVADGEPNWVSTAGGEWSTGTNWSTPPVSESGSSVTFGPKLVASDSVMLYTPFILGSMTFNNIHSYTLGGSGSLILDNCGAAALVSAPAGSHTIGIPVELDSALNVTVDSSSQILKLGAEVSGSGEIVKRGSGDLEFAAENTYSGGTTLGGGNLTVRQPGATFGSGPITLNTALQQGDTGRLRNRSGAELVIPNEVIIGANKAGIEAYSAPLRLTGGLTFNANELQKAGPNELIVDCDVETSGARRFNIRTGTLSVAPGASVLFNNATIRDTLYMSDGTKSARNFIVEEGANVLIGGIYTGSAPSNTVWVNGGTLRVAGSGDESGLIRTVTDMDGTDRIIVNSGELIIPSGRWLSLGVRGGGAEVIVNDGIAELGYVSFGVRAEGTFLSGGATTYANIIVNGGVADITGVLNWMSDIREGRANNVVLNGGKLRLPATFRSTVDTVDNISYMTLNSGVLELTGYNRYNSGNLSDYLSGLSGLVLGSGHVVIDTLGHDVVISQPVQHAGGVGGILTKQGAGSLTFTGSSAAPGATVVEEGVLHFSAGSATTALSLAPGTVFSLRGSTFDSIALGAASIGAGARIDLDVAPDSSGCDTISLPAGFTASSLIIGLYEVGTRVPASTTGISWPIFSYVGTPPDTSGWQVASDSFGGYQFTVNAAAQTIEVSFVSSDEFVSWDNSGGGNWSVVDNWSPSAPAASGASVRFGSALTADDTVNVDTPVSVAGLFFDNSYSYTVAGSAITFESVRVRQGNHIVSTPLFAPGGVAVELAGETTLRITDELGGAGVMAVGGGGSLLLDGTNHLATLIGGGASVEAATAESLGGTITMDSGTLKVQEGGTLSSALILDSGGGTLTAGSGQTLDFDDQITGSGGVTKSGTGIVAVEGNAGYTGTTRSDGGTISFTVMPQGPIVLGSGTFAFNGSGTTDQPVTVNPANRTAVLDVTGELELEGPISALSGNLLKRGSGTVRVTGAHDNVFSVRRIGNENIVALMGDDGSGPTDGVGGISVAEGTLVLGAPGQSNRIVGGAYVGINSTLEPGGETVGELVIVDGYTEIKDYFGIGRCNGSTLTAPQGLVSRAIIEGGSVVADSVSVGASAGLSEGYTGQPELIINGGSLEVKNNFYAGNIAGAVGKIIVNGGYLHYSNESQSIRLGQNGGEGVLCVNGGVADFTRDVIVGYGGLGKTGTVVLAGGELRAARIYSYNRDSHSRVLFDGGVFKPKDGGIDDSIGIMEIGERPAIFDTSIWELSGPFRLARPLTGADSVDGGLVKAGEGEMVIDAVQEYSGPTVVSNGVLSVGAHGGFSSASPLSVMPGATLRLVNLPPKSISVSGLTLGEAGSSTAGELVFSFDYNSGTSDSIEVNGDLNAYSALLVCQWRTAAEESSIPNGRYELIRWTGSGPATTEAFELAPLYPGKSYELTVENKALVLTVGPDSTGSSGAHVWSAAGSGNWSDGSKWYSAPGAGAEGGVVRFDTTITTPASVALNQDATLGELYFNSPYGYTLSGAGSWLTVDNGEDSALIHVEDGSHTVTAPLKLEGDVKTKIFSGRDLTLAGMITGPGSLVKDGSGELVIASQDNTFTGGLHFGNGSWAILTNGADISSSPVVFDESGTLVSRGIGATAAGVVQIHKTGGISVAESAPLSVGGLEIDSGRRLIKSGHGELIFTGYARVDTDGDEMIDIDQGSIRFAAGADYRIGKRSRSGIYIAHENEFSKGIVVDAGASVSLPGIYTGYGAGTTISVDGNLELTGSDRGDAMVLRVHHSGDYSNIDRLVVNPGGILSSLDGGCINVGVRGPAEFLVNGGEAHINSVTLGYQDNTTTTFNGRFGRIHVTDSGVLQVAERMWWISDHNNHGRINWVVADSGGIVSLPNTVVPHAIGWRSLVLDDGTFRANGFGVDPAVEGNYLSGLGSLFIGRSGGTLDTGNHNIGIAQRVASDYPTTLTKSGSGALSLGQALEWAGEVDVQGGVLEAILVAGDERSLPSGLLARYSTESAPGFDSSGYSRHGNAYGAAISSTSDVWGKTGMEFPAGSIVIVPMDEEVRGMDNYTVALWVKRSSVSGGGTHTTFFTTRMNNNNDPYQFMMRTVDGKVRYMATGASDNGWASNVHDSTVKVEPGEWFHAACAVTPTTLRLYVNGQPAGSWTKSNLKFCPPNRSVGDFGFGIGHPYLRANPSGEFAGAVDDVQIYNRALTDEEIAYIVAEPEQVAPALKVARGSSVVLSGDSVVRRVSGEGYVGGKELRVEEMIAAGDAGSTAGASLLVEDLVLSDKVAYSWRWSPNAYDTIHTDHLTINGSGLLDFGRAEGNPINGSFRAVVATYDTIDGAANLASWDVVNTGGKGYVAEVSYGNGEIVLEFQSTRGTLMLLR